MTEPVTVEVLSRDDVVWDFRQTPKARIEGMRFGSVEIDPTPCYTHDPGLARDVAAQVSAAWPAPVPVRFVLLPFEETARTNGLAHYHQDYYDVKAGEPYTHVVVLGGKRIPIHPAMTRYLVAHEYGHHVQTWIQQAMGYKLDDGYKFKEEVYARLRGIEYQGGNGPGLWHTATGEIFACDFRLLVAGVEREFWPHPGVRRPEGMSDLRLWWRKAADLDYSQVSRYRPEDEK